MVRMKDNVDSSVSSSVPLVFSLAIQGFPIISMAPARSRRLQHQIRIGISKGAAIVTC